MHFFFLKATKSKVGAAEALHDFSRDGVVTVSIRLDSALCVLAAMNNNNRSSVVNIASRFNEAPALSLFGTSIEVKVGIKASERSGDALLLRGDEFTSIVNPSKFSHWNERKGVGNNIKDSLRTLNWNARRTIPLAIRFLRILNINGGSFAGHGDGALSAIHDKDVDKAFAGRGILSRIENTITITVVDLEKDISITVHQSCDGRQFVLRDLELTSPGVVFVSGGDGVSLTLDLEVGHDS